MSRRKSLEGLDLVELLSLSDEAIGAFVRRLLQISRRTDPADRAVMELLGEMTADAHRQLESVRLYASHVDSSPRGRLNKDERERILRRFFPMAHRRFGESDLARDQALFFAESLQEECARFHRELAKQAPSGVSKSFFLNMSERCACSIDHLRTVLL